MKALVYIGPEALDHREVPDPTPKDGEVLVKVDSVGICGSDMHAFLGHDERRPAPLILGHEVAGTITGGPRDGTRVTVNPLTSTSLTNFSSLRMKSSWYLTKIKTLSLSSKVTKSAQSCKLTKSTCTD